ncbi:MAG: tRNA pseudouridine(55) synthase TruB [Firmicutes bacterium]|nr:tRNA pseudouridine(55) synthase TruB [Bacillota bacterium]MDY5531137.1 tRNA pseudouridine(55) synthase TruB [Pumilibacteraceae bacterium]
MNGIINVYKPKDCTSQHVVSVVRKFLHTKTVGHMGTLDPQGEGVLPVGVGKATRLFDLLLKKDKIYEAKFKFGYETDTLDKDGNIIEYAEVIPSKDEIIAVLPNFMGKIEQMPPKYSAKNVGGVRAYDLARRGVEFDLKPSAVEIFSIELIEESDENEYLFRIHCSAGTYIRSLCRDIAYKTGSKATMTAIKRTKSGDFTIDNALSPEEIKLLGEKAIIPVEKVLEKLPRVDFPENLYKKISCGVAFEYDKVTEQPFTVYCKGEFFGLGEINDGMFSIKTYLRED